jgi:hypothetical protein
MEQKVWYLQKTFWSGLGIVLTGVLELFTDVLTPGQAGAIMTIFGGLTAIFLREAVEKTKP